MVKEVLVRWCIALRLAGAPIVRWFGRCRALASICRLSAWPTHAVVLAQVSVNPDSGALPGGRQLQQLVNGLAGWALIILSGAVVAGAAWWASGSANSNYNSINGGKRMVLISTGSAILIGAAAALINFFTALGRQV